VQTRSEEEEYILGAVSDRGVCECKGLTCVGARVKRQEESGRVEDNGKHSPHLSRYVHRLRPKAMGDGRHNAQ